MLRLDRILDWLIWKSHGYWLFVVLHDYNVEQYYKKYHEYPGYHYCPAGGYSVPAWVRKIIP